MRETIAFTPEDALPSEEVLLRDQGLPPRERLSPRLVTGFDEAVALYASLAEPRAVLAEIERPVVLRLIAGAEPVDEAPVVARVAARATAFAVYVATLGERISEHVRRLFSEEDLALAWTLDAVASSAADRLGDLVAARFRARLVDRGEASPRVLPYSPGYCGWPTRGQGALFAEIEPADLGVSLTDSFLMVPVKSVSGLVIAGDEQTHLFEADFDFCSWCGTHACAARMASTTG